MLIKQNLTVTEAAEGLPGIILYDWVNENVPVNKLQRISAKAESFSIIN